MARWNRISLRKACESLIERDDFSLRLATIDPKIATAHIEYTWGGTKGNRNFRCTIDASQGGLIESLLHETLHIVVAPEIGDNFNTPLEEVVIRALEGDLWRKGFKTADVKKWRSLIKRKLDGTGDGRGA